MLFVFTFPINNYENNGIFHKQIFFEGESCPTHDQVVDRLQKLAASERNFAYEHPEAGPFTFEYEACLKCIAHICDGDSLPVLEGGCIRTSVRCITDFGKHSIAVKLLITHKHDLPYDERKEYFYGT